MSCSFRIINGLPYSSKVIPCGRACRGIAVIFVDVWREGSVTLLPIDLDFVDDFRKKMSDHSLHRWSPVFLCVWCSRTTANGRSRPRRTRSRCRQKKVHSSPSIRLSYWKGSGEEDTARPSFLSSRPLPLVVWLCVLHSLRTAGYMDCVLFDWSELQNDSFGFGFGFGFGFATLN